MVLMPFLILVVLWVHFSC